jgi:GNAT superfamily N-acetyltransferase
MDPRLLYERMEANLFAWWAGLARSSEHARIVHLRGITAATFPTPGERAVFNNAVASRRAPPAAADVAALAAMYRDLGVDCWQLWVHEEDRRTSAIAGAAGLVIDTSTMTMALDLVATDLQAWSSLPIIRDPDIEDVRGVLYNADAFVPMVRAAGATIYALRLDGEPASCLVSLEHDGGCGIYALETAERFRRRGLARALVLHALWDGRERGCTSASLQSTAMAEALYAGVGFQPMGRYVEWQRRG